MKPLIAAVFEVAHEQAAALRRLLEPLWVAARAAAAHEPRPAVDHVLDVAVVRAVVRSRGMLITSSFLFSDF